MNDRSAIEWCDASSNPTTGCDRTKSGLRQPLHAADLRELDERALLRGDPTGYVDRRIRNDARLPLVAEMSGLAMLLRLDRHTARFEAFADAWVDARADAGEPLRAGSRRPSISREGTYTVNRAVLEREERAAVMFAGAAEAPAMNDRRIIAVIASAAALTCCTETATAAAGLNRCEACRGQQVAQRARERAYRPAGDGRVCEALGRGRARRACRQVQRVVAVRISARRYPYTANRISDAIGASEPGILHLDRAGGDANRTESLEDIPTRDGFDRDEVPPTVDFGFGLVQRAAHWAWCDGPPNHVFARLVKTAAAWLPSDR